MNIRHAAVLAFVGWYLMVPPLIQHGTHYLVERNAPIANWKMVSALDSAAACQQGILNEIAGNRKLAIATMECSSAIGTECNAVLVQEAVLGAMHRQRRPTS